MRRLAQVLAVAFACLAGAGPALAQPPSGIVRPTQEPGHATVELGRELYAGNCASCHGIAGRGISRPRPGAGDLMGMGPSLRGVGAQAPDFYLRTGYMPLGDPHEQPYGNRVLFSGKEIKSLVAYVASLGRGPSIPHPDPSAGSLSEGQHLFTENCAGCHQLEARGGFVTGARVPPLQNVKAVRIAEAVRIGPYLMPKFPRSEISNSELNSIIRYIETTNHPDNKGGWSIGNLGPIPEGLVAWWIAIPLVLLGCLAVSRRMRKE
ncbi:MAG TPA: c-type cytochrome [Solirubrobacteraceae bacterium]|nr:c-type cytochrome [Solirubrobacteraceae bacterium]